MSKCQKSIHICKRSKTKKQKQKWTSCCHFVDRWWVQDVQSLENRINLETLDMISTTSMLSFLVWYIKSKKNNIDRISDNIIVYLSRNCKKTVFWKTEKPIFLSNYKELKAKSLSMLFFFNYTHHTRIPGLETSEIIHRVSKFFLFSKL